MRAKVRQFRDGQWLTTEVATDPLRARFEGDTERSGDELKLWTRDLPPVLIEHKSTRFTEDPEGWLIRMAKLRYTRITVELLD